MPTHKQLLADAHHAFRQGRLDAADPLYRQILSLRPRDTDALLGLALLCTHKKRYDEAVTLFQQVIALKPYAVEAIGNLGVALAAADRHEEAIAAFKQVLALTPNHAPTYYNLGISYKGSGNLDEAAAAYRRAIELKPDYAAAFFNLGNTLRAARKLDEAIAAFHEALRLDPRHAEAANNLGHSLKEQFAFDEAITHFRRAIDMKPGFADPFGALAGALETLGQADEAIPLYRHHLTLTPDDPLSHAGLLSALRNSPAVAPQSVFEEHVRWAQRHAPASPISPHPNDPSPERRLRVGYVSPDFREHSVAYFLENLLAFHDRRQVETFCYSAVAFPDAITARFQQHAAHWRNVAPLNDEALAALIRRDQIDLLVDLAGHTAGNRLQAFALKPAPIQIAYLGYVDTTGMTQMDYRLVDAHTDPPGMTESLHTERLIRLPNTFACYRPPEESPPVSPPPALANGYITFASFGVAAKITREMLLLWADLMSRLPRSRILFASVAFTSATLRERFLATLASRGISPDRVEFAPLQKMAAYLDMHRRVDILLDTFPVNGHTISCHALWMGVPIISRAGRKYVSRLGASVLANLHLEELLAHTSEEYLSIAVGLANDLPRLTSLRAGMRERMTSSPLMDYTALARSIEEFYRVCWRSRCPGGASVSRGV